MRTRSEENQELYKEIDQKNKELEAKADNSSFESVENNLHAVNPNLFSEKTSSHYVEKKRKINKSLIKRIACFVIIVIGVLVIWMVIK